MTFSEYFNALYPYLSDNEEPLDFYDSMMGNFISEEAQEACKLLNCPPDTKRRYIQKKNARKINPAYANYAHSKHDSEGYIGWLYDRINKLDTFEKIEDWLTDNEIDFYDVSQKCDELLEDIFFKIAFPSTEDPDALELPPSQDSVIEENPILQRLSENDKKLLKDFCMDYDGILEKCITGSHADIWFTGKFSGKINALNDKWRDLITELNDVRLQSDILGTIAALKDFCNALDPSNTATLAPLRKLRLELQNCYVKIHPDKYSGLFPYEPIIDDWDYEYI
ncbi:MAG: hypothetical protein IKW90_02785 [Lachnospiraceae bacterium]|nr:hypothetical protein [Lachnospiraceae bacterium]